MAFGLTSASNGEQLAQDGTAHRGQRHDTGRAGKSQHFLEVFNRSLSLRIGK